MKKCLLVLLVVLLYPSLANCQFVFGFESRLLSTGHHNGTSFGLGILAEHNLGKAASIGIALQKDAKFYDSREQDYTSRISSEFNVTEQAGTEFKKKSVCLTVKVYPLRILKAQLSEDGYEELKMPLRGFYFGLSFLYAPSTYRIIPTTLNPDDYHIDAKYYDNTINKVNFAGFQMNYGVEILLKERYILDINGGGIGLFGNPSPIPTSSSLPGYTFVGLRFKYCLLPKSE